MKEAQDARKKHLVRPGTAERERLRSLVKAGKAAAYKARHAHILPAVHEASGGPALTDERAAGALNMSVGMIEQPRRRVVSAIVWRRHGAKRLNAAPCRPMPPMPPGEPVSRAAAADGGYESRSTFGRGIKYRRQYRRAFSRRAAQARSAGRKSRVDGRLRTRAP